MKLQELTIGESIIKYTIHYYDEKKEMWCPYINEKGYSFFSDEFLIYELTQAKKITSQLRVYRSTTTRTQ